MATFSLLVDQMGNVNGGPRLYTHTSTETSTEILSAGFFVGVGYGSQGLLGQGVRIGDVICHIASTNSATPGVVSFHSAINSTAGFSSTSASSGYSAAYNVTVSATS